MFSSQGTLQVSGSGDPDKWWLHVACCDELGRYYRQWVLKTFGIQFYGLMRPAWRTHITVVRREVVDANLLYAYDGQEVSFDYDPEGLITNEKHFWIPVICPALLQIREKVGLKAIPDIPFHLTFGVMPGGAK